MSAEPNIPNHKQVGILSFYFILDDDTPELEQYKKLSDTWEKLEKIAREIHPYKVSEFNTPLSGLHASRISQYNHENVTKYYQW